MPNTVAFIFSIYCIYLARTVPGLAPKIVYLRLEGYGKKVPTLGISVHRMSDGA
jgi:hypothetical protein